MEATEIIRILSQDPVTQAYFQGVYASDTIPHLSEKSAIVVNLDKSTQPGSHWVGFFIHENKTLEFFDSYGNAPDFYGDQFHSFLSKYPNLHWNSIAFQSPTSNVCGAYCIYFIYKKCQGHSLYTIVDNLTQCKNNDFRMYQFVKKKYGVRMIFKK